MSRFRAGIRRFLSVVSPSKCKIVIRLDVGYNQWNLSIILFVCYLQEIHFCSRKWNNPDVYPKCWNGVFLSIIRSEFTAWARNFVIGYVASLVVRWIWIFPKSQMLSVWDNVETLPSPQGFIHVLGTLIPQASPQRSSLSQMFNLGNLLGLEFVKMYFA